jgi:hypothetical protein
VRDQAREFVGVLSLSSAKTKITKKEKGNYGFQREGYGELPYFNDYSGSIITYSILDDMDAVIEPNANMQFRYYGSSDLTNKYYSITVVDQSSGDTIGSGAYYPEDSTKDEMVNCDCSPLSKLRVQVVEYSTSNGAKTKNFNLQAMCIYVRRELRSLTDSDLSKAMDAMYTLWEYTDAEGQPTYGKEYHGIVYFASMHDFNAAWQDGDHIHEGLGFMPQHIKMTNMFEKVMQVVDPSVTLPYWDFTIESTDKISLYDSPMFTSDTFGSLNPSKGSGDDQWTWSGGDSVEDGYIPDGRWASMKAIRNPFEDYLPSAYGFMRGPWCMNPAPRVTRYTAKWGTSLDLTLPSCRDYVSWLEDDDKMSFLKTAEDSPHAVVHGAIGGVFGCDTLKEMQDAGYLETSSEGLATVCAKWSFFMKEMYRANLVLPKSDCSAQSLDKDSLTCGFTCDDSEASTWIDTFSDLSISKYVPDESNNDEGWEAWRQFACNGNGYLIFTGDQLESASPIDPSFWSIHPTQERLYHAKMLSGGLEESQWPNTTCSAHSCDWVCNHAKCYDYTGENTEKDFYTSCCAGHFEDDQLLDYTNSDRSQGYGPTNSQTFLDIDPTSSDYANTYIYDHFEWPHCETGDVKDIKKKMLSLAEEKGRKRRLRG